MAAINQTESLLQAWLHLDRSAPAPPGSGPLRGIPLGIKDIIDVKGMPTTAGSRVPDRSPAGSDAPCITALRESGAEFLGKTNTHEFAYGAVTPPTNNPWDLGRIPGGSSGGSAAAVAAGNCLGALGSDTAGSIRIPASLCGVSGLKPRPGIVPLDGVIALAPSLDAVGPIARSCADLQTIWQVMSSTVPPEQSSFVLALPNDDDVFPDLDEDVASAYEQAGELLGGLASSKQSSNLPRFDEFDFPRSVLLMSEAFNVHKTMGYWPGKAPDYSEETRSYLQMAEQLSGVEGFDDQLKEAVVTLSKLADEFSSFLSRADVLILPTVSRTAPTHSEAEEVDESSPRRPVVMELTRLPAPSNVARLASLSIPCGFSRDDLPIGIQLVGRDEWTILHAGAAYQAQTDWHLRRPPLMANPG